ncbi:MAG: ParB/RepB/Spo0J family partition protein [Clostridiales bacterium]|nr:ParB/RepB/Spo0J family partition protein [Clostridiales bacterium]
MFKTKQNNLINIPLSKLLPNPCQPRMYFDEKSLESLKNSILEYGMINPVTVRKTSLGYELICGERRFRAAQLAGLYEIPAVVVETTEDKCAILSLLENLQREDLTFFEVAQSYEKLIREQGFTQEKIAEKVGKSRASISNKLRLLRLSPQIRRLIREYDISERHAAALLRLKDENDRIEVVKRICINSLSVEETNRLIDEINHPKKKRIREQKKASSDNLSFFKNTVAKAVDIMKRGGVDASIEEESFDWGTQYMIQIKNK